ncbi:MAG: adenylate cyclase regulatory domain-containing protein [Actinomycetota bacterium]
MDALSRDELAERAGVPAEFIDKLVDLQIVVPTEGAYRVSDLYRVRLAKALEEAGLDLDAIGSTIAAGKFSLAFMDLPNWRWAGLSPKSFREASAETGVPLELALDTQEAAGFSRPRPDDPVREDDLEMLQAVALALGAGIPGSEALRVLRAFGEGFRQITDAERTVFHEFVEMPLLRSGLDQTTTMAIAQQFGSQITPLQERAIVAMYRRYQERAWTEDTIDHAETALEEMGLYRRPDHPPAMCFLDLSGYTRLTEERGDRAAAELAGRLAEMVQRTSRGHGGQPVKWLGDGVMFHFKNPGPGVVAALEMVQRAPDSGLLPAHAGVAAGPVVAQGGDFFGRTVNMASRVAAYAAPGQTLVTDEVVESCDALPVRFEEIGTVELKGVARPVRLHEAVRLEA